MSIWFVVLIVSLFIFGLIVLVRSEIKLYNKGVCKCGGKWESFTLDSQGGVGFECRSCGNTIWIDETVVYFCNRGE